MLGQRKKIHKEEVSQKKKWELELAEDEELAQQDAINIDPKEIPKQDSDDEKMQQNQELLENSLKS